jgi:hypothetical protein
MIPLFPLGRICAWFLLACLDWPKSHLGALSQDIPLQRSTYWSGCHFDSPFERSTTCKLQGRWIRRGKEFPGHESRAAKPPPHRIQLWYLKPNLQQHPLRLLSLLPMHLLLLLR